MSVFRFKRFAVRNERAAMKVNTDGVLLGVCAPLMSSDLSILDIGTGTGVIALMLAQRLADLREGPCGEIAPRPGIGAEPEIIGIDIDPDAAAEAEENFRSSPWTEALTSLEVSLDGLEQRLGDSGKMFDLIVSNPPYYDSSLTNPDERKATARHTGGESLSFREVMDFAERRLADGGRLAIVLPADQENALTRYGRMKGLFASNILRIRTVERKKPIRTIAVFSRERRETEESVLTIMEKGEYTSQYTSLTKDFYLFS